MACLSLSIGDFTEVTFATSLSGVAAGKSVSLDAGGLSVAGSQILSAVSGFQLSAAILGGQFLVVMSVEQSLPNALSSRRISVVNLATSAVTEVLHVSAISNISLPTVQASPGNPSLLALWAPDGPTPLGQILGAAIVRADNGNVLIGGIGGFTATGTILGGQVTATEVLFRYHALGSPKQAAIPRPAGAATITSSNPQNFGSLPIGGCPVTPPTRTYTIRNSGNDCLLINSIAPSGPYSVTGSTPALPVTLDPTQTVDVEVTFNPGAVGTFNNASLALAPVPPNGPVDLKANGSAVAAAPSATFSATTFNFNKVPNGVTPPAKTLTITNNGTAPLTVNVAAGAASGFSWSAVNTTLACGANATVTIGFSAGLPEGPKSASFLVVHGATGSPKTIDLLASVCVANPEITAPPAAPIDFGQIQQGFRTVRLLKSVKNPGDGPLSFTAEIISTSGSNPAQALLGIPDPAGGQIDGPQSRNISVLPAVPCGGSAGSGTIDVPISLFADQAPGVVTGLALRITSTNPAFSRDYPLSFEIIPPIPLDVALVVDRSGSMDDSLGSRKKIDAAISAGQLFVELLRPDLDDRVALVRFSTSPDLLQGITAVSSTIAPTQSQIRDMLAADIPPANGWTGIAGGALLGLQEVQKPRTTTPPQITKAVVVLTDGIENRAYEDPPGSGQWFTVLGGPSLTPSDAPVASAPMTFPGNVKVFAVGLGHNGEVSDAQLNQLMQPAGTPFRVDQDLSGTKYFELEKRFTQIYMDMADMATITDPMYWIGPGDTHNIEFEVLPGDVGALVIIYDWEGMRLPFHCETPMGEIIDPVAIPPGFQLRAGVTPSTRLVEIKMPKGEPKRYAGTWKVVIHHPKVICRGTPTADKESKGVGFVSRRGCKEVGDPLLYGIAIGVGSNFRMQPYVTPGPVYVGEPILLSAMLSEAGLPITGGLVTVRAEAPNGAVQQLTLADDGAHLDSAPNDGEYAWQFTATPVDGVYHFTFRAEGKSREGQTVVREAVRDKEVLRKGRPPGGHDGGDRPGDGSSGGDECCKKLLSTLHEQNVLLRRIADQRKA